MESVTSAVWGQWRNRRWSRWHRRCRKQWDRGGDGRVNTVRGGDYGWGNLLLDVCINFCCLCLLCWSLQERVNQPDSHHFPSRTQRPILTIRWPPSPNSSTNSILTQRRRPPPPSPPPFLVDKPLTLAAETPWCRLHRQSRPQHVSGFNSSGIQLGINVGMKSFFPPLHDDPKCTTTSGKFGRIIKGIFWQGNIKV